MSGSLFATPPTTQNAERRTQPARWRGWPAGQLDTILRLRELLRRLGTEALGQQIRDPEFKLHFEVPVAGKSMPVARAAAASGEDSEQRQTEEQLTHLSLLFQQNIKCTFISSLFLLSFLEDTTR